MIRIHTLALLSLFACALSTAGLAVEPTPRVAKLRVEVDSLRAKALALKDMGQPEQAAKLMADADKLLVQIEEMPPSVAPLPAPTTTLPATATKPRRDRLSGPRGRIDELRQLSAKMAAAGRTEDAARLDAEADSIAARYSQQWEIEMAVMQEQAGRLRSDNEEAAAKKIEVEIQGRNDDLRRLEEARAATPRPTPVGRDERASIQRRIEDLQLAQTHLRAANHFDLADQIGREVAQLQARLAPLTVASNDDVAALKAEVETLRKEIAALKTAMEQQRSVLVAPAVEKK